MSIEIRELIIKTLVEEGIKKDPKAGSGGGVSAPADDCSLLSIREQIVEECIEKTLEIIERKLSR
ncbi:MAG: DUF5908 family protein [Chitinophagales bacterium]